MKGKSPCAIASSALSMRCATATVRAIARNCSSRLRGWKDAHGCHSWHRPANEERKPPSLWTGSRWSTVGNADAYGISHGVIQAGHLRRHGAETDPGMQRADLWRNADSSPTCRCSWSMKRTRCARKPQISFRIWGVSRFWGSPRPLYEGAFEALFEPRQRHHDGRAYGGWFPRSFENPRRRSADTTGAGRRQGMVRQGTPRSAHWHRRRHRQGVGGQDRTALRRRGKDHRCFRQRWDHGAELCRKFNAAGYRFEQISLP